MLGYNPKMGAGKHAFKGSLRILFQSFGEIVPAAAAASKANGLRTSALSTGYPPALRGPVGGGLV